MKTLPRLVLFAIVAAAQLAVPASMIMGHEAVLAYGTPYQFKCRTIDPYDPFRGRYVTLSFDQEEVPVAPGSSVGEKGRAYASLTVDSEGWAHVTSLSDTPPSHGDYLLVDGFYFDGDKMRVTLPFDRYYMNEFDAPAAERAYFDHARVGESGVHAVVRVYKGKGIVEALYIGDMRVEDYIKQTPATPQEG